MIGGFDDFISNVFSSFYYNICEYQDITETPKYSKKLVKAGLFTRLNELKSNIINSHKIMT